MRDFQGLLPGGEEPEPEVPRGAVGRTVEAEVAFGLFPGQPGHGIVAALAVAGTATAVVARFMTLLQPQHRPARDQAQQRAKRADRAAPEAGDAPVQQQHPAKQQGQQQTLMETGLPDAEQLVLQQGAGGPLRHDPYWRSRRLVIGEARRAEDPGQVAASSVATNDLRESPVDSLEVGTVLIGYRHGFRQDPVQVIAVA